ncbi:hypothetical protein OH77DRAFT_1424225 [Trametes cingulata]|nr:hypothetical protein OH77DRAFT_1424225 [Trametes cingulata]
MTPDGRQRPLAAARIAWTPQVKPAGAAVGVGAVRGPHSAPRVAKQQQRLPDGERESVEDLRATALASVRTTGGVKTRPGGGIGRGKEEEAEARNEASGFARNGGGGDSRLERFRCVFSVQI